MFKRNKQKINQAELNTKYAECVAAEKRALQAYYEAEKIIAECRQVQREQKLIVEAVLKMLANNGAVIQSAQDVVDKMAGWNVGRMPEMMQ
jgi:intergrase/recombinase